MLCKIESKHFGTSKNSSLMKLLAPLCPTTDGVHICLEINTIMDIKNLIETCMLEYDKYISDTSKFKTPSTLTLDPQTLLLTLNDE